MIKLGDEYMQSFYFLLSLHICLKFSIIKSFLKDSKLVNDLIHRTIQLIRMITNIKLLCEFAIIIQNIRAE